MELDDDCFRLFVDGASRGNPGPAGAGARLLDAEGRLVDESARYLGHRTNNQAEYEALILGLNRVRQFRPPRLRVYSDSELLVRQMRGEFRVRNEGLKPLYRTATGLVESLSSVEFERIPREQNREADRLANLGIDQNS